MATRKFANFVNTTNFESIPSKVREHSKMMFLDWLGVTLAGSKEKIATVMMDFIMELDGESESGEATIIGKNVRTDIMKAALINGSMSHVLDLDDYHGGTLNHPTVAVLPAIMAVAENKKLGGKDIITALTVAFDVLVRIGYGAGREHYDRGWHATSTLGKFGATAGVGKLLGLNVEQMINAFGIAGTLAGGVRQVFGTMGKSFHAGKASQDGILAAMLAQKGFECSKEIIEGKHGFMDLFAQKTDFKKMLDNLGKDFYLPTVSFKPYASCGGTHSTIDVMKDIRNNKNFKINEVAEISLELGSIALEAAGKVEPATGLEAKFSTYFCAALALTEGEAGIDKFTDEKANDPGLNELRKKVKITILKPDIHLAARAAVKMKDGSIFKSKVDVPKGDPANPVSYLELVNKFNGLATNIISQDKIKTLVEQIKSLENIQNINQLLKLCHN